MAKNQPGGSLYAVYFMLVFAVMITAWFLCTFFIVELYEYTYTRWSNRKLIEPNPYFEEELCSLKKTEQKGI